MITEWKYVKKLLSEDRIKEFEETVKLDLPEDFKKCVVQNNGGRPDLRTFDTDKEKERSFKSLLSFNTEDRETVWKTLDACEEELSDKYVAFGIDNFGNLICFDRKNSSVIFLNAETLTTEYIAPTFTAFLDKLYE